MNKQEIKNFTEFKINKYTLNEIRESNPMIHLYESPLIGTEEIRQFAYCKRIIFFRHIIHAPMKTTYKMEYGMKKHEQLQKYTNKSEEINSQKYYNVYLSDPSAGLVGLIDYFEYDGNEAYPVEIKSGNIPPVTLEDPHKYQVSAQAILIEKNFDFLVKKVRIVYSKHKKVVDHFISMEDKLAVLKMVNDIRKMIYSEKIPPPTKDMGKCIDCECKNYCLRV